MGYMNLMRAKQKSGKAPSLRPNRWSRLERERIEKQICVKCEASPLSANSYLCPRCESSNTVEDIRREVTAARRKVKNG